MDKRLGRNILYGLSMLAFCGLLLYGARFDRAPSVSIRERGSANASVLEELEAAKAPEPDRGTAALSGAARQRELLPGAGRESG